MASPAATEASSEAQGLLEILAEGIAATEVGHETRGFRGPDLCEV